MIQHPNTNNKSIINVIATFIFIDVLYIQLTKGEYSSRYIWLFPRFYTDILRSFLERAYESIEWALASPPSPHSFTSLPTQSSYFKSLYTYIYTFLRNKLKSVFNSEYVRNKLSLLIVSYCMSLLVCMPFTILLITLDLDYLIIVLKTIYAALIYLILYNLRYKDILYKGPGYLDYILVMLTALAISTVLYIIKPNFASLFILLISHTGALYLGILPSAGGGPSNTQTPAAPTASTGAAGHTPPTVTPAIHPGIPPTATYVPGNYIGWSGNYSQPTAPPVGTPPGSHALGEHGWHKAGKEWGPLHVDNPYGQSNEYNPAGNNQPRLSNMGRSLERQRQLNVNRFNNKFFTEGDLTFFLGMLRHKDFQTWQKLTQNADTSSSRPSWMYQGNNKELIHKMMTSN